MISQLAQQQAVGIRHARALAFGRLSCRQRARVRAVACAKLAWGSPFSNASRRPRLVTCASKSDTEISGYTPAEYITYSDDPQHTCCHVIEAVVNAPPEVCFEWWSDWQRLVDFLDLIGQIGLDDKSPDMALFQCYYRWAKLPVMEITFLLEKTRVEPGKRIDFKSVWGMPMEGSVQLSPEPDSSSRSSSATRVRLAFNHPMPNLLLELQIGTFAIETHLQQILADNMDTYKAAVERAAAAAGGSAAAGGGASEKPPGALKQRAEELKREQQQRQEAAGDTGPSASGGEAGGAGVQKQRRTRGATAARKSASAAEVAPDAEQQQQAGGEAAGAAPAVAKKGRGSRRSTAAASSNGAPQAAGPGAEGEAGTGTGTTAGRRGRPRSSTTR